MGPDPAGLAAGLAAADLREARQEPRWVGDDLDRTDLAPRAPATNWIPTPSTAYYEPLYGVPVSTQIQPITRIYYPAPGSDTQASILPPPNEPMGATYVYPPLQLQQ